VQKQHLTSRSIHLSRTVDKHSVQLDKFPKAVLQAYVVVLEDGGGALAAAITGTSLALLDAGIEM
jgi:ribonuclease PH